MAFSDPDRIAPILPCRRGASRWAVLLEGCSLRLKTPLGGCVAVFMETDHVD
jgi:hypothetical protein